MLTIRKIGNLIYPTQIWRHFWANRYLIGQLTWRDFGQRYRGSYLGLLWSIINPLVLLLIYTFVFSVVFRARWQPEQVDLPMGEFAIILFAGLVPFYFFSEVINRAPSLVLNNPNYVKKVVFPVEVLVVVASGTALFTSLINLGILFGAMLIFQHPFHLTMFLLPLLYIPLLLVTGGIAWFLASLGVYIRDIGLFISLVIQVLLFISPIFYPISAVPPTFQAILRLNPLTLIVTGFRDVILWGNLFPLTEWAVWVIVGLVLFLAGYIWFMWTKKGFADVL